MKHVLEVAKYSFLYVICVKLFNLCEIILWLQQPVESMSQEKHPFILS